MLKFFFLHEAVFCSGSGPDGRITRKDIENFVPPKAAPVSKVSTLFCICDFQLVILI